MTPSDSDEAALREQLTTGLRRLVSRRRRSLSISIGSYIESEMSRISTTRFERTGIP